jgi:DNA ligase-1
MKLLVPLFKLDSKNVLRIWQITANDPDGTYTVEHGVYGGAIQKTTVRVKPKNIGRSNETMAWQQAESEADSKWNKQIDKGYRPGSTKDITQPASTTRLLKAKTGLPMLAKSYKDHAKKIVFPCYVQPKLDGIRCLAIRGNLDVPVLFSRKGKRFEHISHLGMPLKTLLLQYPGWTLDGELFSKTLDFQTITSIVRQGKKSHPRANEIEYHIYDCFQETAQATFETRLNILQTMSKVVGPHGPLVFVDTQEITCEQEVTDSLRKHELLGYEGVMLRNKHGLYEQDRRSEHLQKVKSFMDAEFQIIGGREGKGKFEGMCIFRCRTPEGKEFDVMPTGDEALRRSYWDNLTLHLGQLLTVKFFEYTVDGIPRFPVGLGVRDYE